MPILESLLVNTQLTLVRGNPQTEVKSLHFDSRQVAEDSVFFAIPGLKTDGHQFIPKAIESGATVIISESLPEEMPEGITFFLSPNAARDLGIMAANFYDRPAEKMQVIGVTGTNGKTTTATLFFDLFQRLGYSAGLISTVQNQINQEILPSKYTTPDALSIQSLLAKMQQKGCTHCFMEVSSHALVQERTAGLRFSGAIFSNISHDHLDFHPSFQDYIEAKKKLFDELSPAAFALVNRDDKRGEVMLQNSPAKRKKTFALKTPADFKAKLIENTLEGLLLEIDHQEVWFRLIGHFNAYNLLSVYAGACLMGENPSEVLTELSALKAAAGRFEQVPNPLGVHAIVDYAHTPDALLNVLKTIGDLKQTHQKVWTIVGCGGDRDRRKRPEMAKIASEYSDQVILTSDNPRSEDPQAIIEEMLAGVKHVPEEYIQSIENREEAIKKACQSLKKGDIILVAGKGHENYQEIKGQRYDFDDVQVLKKYLRQDLGEADS